MIHRVHQIAKDLGIESKDIVKKLLDEGIPPPSTDKDKTGGQKPWTHMSPVGAGLEATVREWFAAGSLNTAVETTEHVAAMKIQKSPRKRSHKKGASAGDSGEGGVAVAELPTAEAPSTMEMPAEEGEIVAPVETIEETVAAAAPEAPVTQVAAPVEAEVVEAAPIAAAAPVAPSAPAAPAAPKVEAAPELVKEIPAKPIVPAVPVRPAAVAVAPAKPAMPEVPQKPVRPVIRPMGIPNVPTRPTSVAPVGPQVKPAPARVQGPNVIRMDQPDNLPAPRAGVRRPPMGGGQGQGMGSGQGQGRPGTGAGPGMAAPLMPPTGASSRKSGASRGDAVPVDDEEAAAKKKGRTTRRTKTGRSADAGVEAIREWREADLLEREERLATASGELVKRKREMSKQQRAAMGSGQHVQSAKPTHIEITPPITVRELSEAMGVKTSDVLKKLMSQGTMATVNQTVEPDAAQVLALEFGLELVIKARESLAAVVAREYTEREEISEKTGRAPVVTILGHVDHGKTSLLDKIRSANVAAGEAGGITQHVGAYTVEITGGDGKPKRVTFLDTPGHQAFTAMRARGANMTDVVVLVVAADDGVMPQTIESINHAKAAGVPIVVAMNKIDKPDANPNKVLGQLAEQGLNPVEWGGDTEVVKTSAVTGQGVKELIEMLDFTAALKELKASPALPARGAVIEAFMDPNRGVVARVLVQNGTLHVGDTLVCGPAWGRVRSIADDKLKPILEAGPSSPVEVIGLDGVPAPGDKFYALEDPNEAREIAEERTLTDREGEIAKRRKVTLENLYDTIQQGEIKELRVILKGDVQGSVDVLKHLLNEELSKEVKVRLLHAAVGGITESDVLLAEASDAIIIGFSVVPDEAARKIAEATGVDVRLYRIIYEITDDIRKALTGMLSPTKQDQILGHAEVRQVIKVSKVGNIGGCQVTDGILQRSNKYRLLRDGTVVVENLTLESLKRFKEDVKEVRGGLECGIKLAGYDDIKIGDRLEAYKTVDVARTL